MPEAAFETPLDATTVLEIALLMMLVVVALTMMKLRHLFAVAMLSGVYSLLSASFFVVLDAVDVAFTEAAVGAGVSTVLLLGAMLLTSRREKPVTSGRAPVALAIVTITGAALIYATFDMPSFADPESPANAHVGREYIERSQREIGMPNIVTGVLASYRGYDTLGEVVVVFTAGVAVVMLLGMGGGARAPNRRPVAPNADDEEE